MILDTLRETLLWCAVMNYGVLLVWFLLFTVAHDWLHRLHGRWFRLSLERFDAVHYAGMAMYKIAVVLLNLVPYLALRLVG